MLKYKILLKLYVLSWCVDALCFGRISHYESVHGHESFKINNPFVYKVWVSPYGSIVFFVCMYVCVCVFVLTCVRFTTRGSLQVNARTCCLLYSKLRQPNRRRLPSCYRVFILRSDGGQMSVSCDYCSHCLRNIAVNET